MQESNKSAVYVKHYLLFMFLEATITILLLSLHKLIS